VCLVVTEEEEEEEASLPFGLIHDTEIGDGLGVAET
jgi:hypothetical protein